MNLLNLWLFECLVSCLAITCRMYWVVFPLVRNNLKQQTRVKQLQQWRNRRMFLLGLGWHDLGDRGGQGHGHPGRRLCITQQC